MKMYVEAMLKISEHNNFAGENGETVEYDTNYLKDNDGNMLIVNSKASFAPAEGKSGVAILEIREDSEKKNRFRISLKGFAEGQVIEDYHGTVY